jgi:Protein of unknown function (DUF3040)
VTDQQAPETSMTLAADDRRALSRIEGALRRSDPKLAAMLATFNRLNQAERMPARERLRAPRLRWSPRLWWSARSGSRVCRRLFAPLPPGSSAPGSSAPGRPIAALRGRPSRFAQIVPVIMATCALGLMLVMFTVLAHARPGPPAQARGARCIPTVIMSCQPASGSAGTTVSRPGSAG